MRVPVKLIAVRGGLPPGFDEGGDGAVEAAPGATVADVLGALGLPADEEYVTLVDDEPVPPAKRARRQIAGGEALTVFPPIKGGSPPATEADRCGARRSLASRSAA